MTVLVISSIFTIFTFQPLTNRSR